MYKTATKLRVTDSATIAISCPNPATEILAVPVEFTVMVKNCIAFDLDVHIWSNRKQSGYEQYSNRKLVDQIEDFCCQWVRYWCVGVTTSWLKNQIYSLNRTLWLCL